MSACRVIAPHNHLATLAVGDAIRADAGVAAHIGCRGVLHGRIGALKIAAHQHRAATRVAGRVDMTAKQADLVTQNLHRAARLPSTHARSLQRARDRHHTSRATFQPDNAIFFDQAVGLDDTIHVDDGVQQRCGRACRQQHRAAISANHPAVIHQGIDCGLVNLDVEQLVARQVQRDRIASRQGDRAQLRRNHALVADVGTQQGHIACVGGVDRSLVDDRARACAGKLVIARHEVGVADGQGGRHQPADIDRRALTEQDAVGVDQEHLAVGRQTAQNVGRICANHPVERHRTAARLHELHRLAGLDAEALPVDRHVRRGLGNRHVGGAAANGGAAGCHDAACGLRLDAGPAGQHQRNRQDFQAEAGMAACRRGAGRGFLAGAAGIFRNSHKGAGLVVPDGAVNDVHDGLSGDLQKFEFSQAVRRRCARAGSKILDGLYPEPARLVRCRGG